MAPAAASGDALLVGQSRSAQSLYKLHVTESWRGYAARIARVRALWQVCTAGNAEVELSHHAMMPQSDNVCQATVLEGMVGRSPLKDSVERRKLISSVVLTASPTGSVRRSHCSECPLLFDLVLESELALT